MMNHELPYMNDMARAGSPILRVLYSVAVILFPVAAAILFLTVSPAGAAEFSIRPGITLSEEYDDNIFLTAKDREDDFVTRVMPSILFKYKVDRWDLDLNYAFDYRYYDKRTRKDDTTHAADVKSRMELIKSHFFLDVADSYKRVSLDTARDFTHESLFVNQSDSNVFTVNPYLVLNYGARTTPVIGYTYVNTWYKDPRGIDTIDQTGYADVTTQLSSRTTFTIGAKQTRGESETFTYDRTDAYAGMRFVYTPNSSIYITAGNSWFDFGEGRRETQPFWNTGITHTYVTITASFEAGLSYIPDPLRVVRREDRYVATISRTTARSTLSVSGSLREYRNVETKHLENTSYRLGGAMRYAVTARTSIAADLATERQEEYQTRTTRDLYLNGVRFEHRVLEKVTASLEYRYTNSYSADLFVDNYYDNRVIFEIRGSF